MTIEITEIEQKAVSNETEISEIKTGIDFAMPISMKLRNETHNKTFTPKSIR